MPVPALNAIRSHRLRKSPPMSQEDLARRIGSTQWNVSAYERGDRLPTLHKAIAIAAALGTHVEEVFFGLHDLAAHQVGGRVHETDPT
ncbi:MAG: helix-turn-helix transcriptional regulator [Myxococcota bacterium]